MVNELYTLVSSFKQSKVTVDQPHPWVKPLGRSDVLIAGVDTSSLISTIEYIDQHVAVTLFKIQKNNHANFPAVNWPSPIWNLDLGSSVVRDWLASPVADVRCRVGLLRTACESAPVSPGQNRALQRTQQLCRDLTPRFRAEDECEFAAFSILMERLLRLTQPMEDWLANLSDAALRSAEVGSAAVLAAVEALLAGRFNDKTSKLERTKVPILFDLADDTNSYWRVASPRMGGYFSRRLTATEAAASSSGRCALTGQDMALEVGKMPSPRLPVLGDTVLMSMNPDAPCQTRYGRSGAAIFPIGRKTASDMNTALLYLTARSRERKNWKRIPGRNKKKSNLLLVYLEAAPLFDVDIADLFSGPDGSGKLYSTICAEVCNALRRRKARDRDLLRLVVLNKIDPGRVQIELSDTFTAEQVIRGSEEWQEGAKNRPPLSVRNDDLVPSPSQAMRCLQLTWERGRVSHGDAPACHLTDIYDILIAGKPTAQSTAEILLRMTLQRSSDLLAEAGNAAHRGGKGALNRISRAKDHPVIAASLMSIALNKLGFGKHNYMQEPAFLIGRILSLVDTLHAEYSRTVRNDIPPQLMGNALIPTVMTSPQKGLARMLQRIRIYHAWARSKEGTGLARWSFAEMGKIATAIAPNLPDQRLTEAQKAQLLLGYLARTERQEGGQRKW